ncbi:MAG TPA: hypothetical protein VH306_12290 [Gaiellaceae bacterium]|jgi:hypothetical protein
MTDVRRLSLLLVGLTALAVVAASTASAAPSERTLERYLTSDTQWIALDKGRGTASFTARGAILGNLKKGSIRIVDLPRGLKTKIRVWGADHVSRAAGRARVYSGVNLGFRVWPGWWKLRIAGRGIAVSAAVHGTMTLVGKAGTYRIGSGRTHAWPRKKRIFHLG